MPRYFFTAWGPSTQLVDAGGEEHPSLEEAHGATLVIARDLVRDVGLNCEEWSFQIKDGTGCTLMVVPFTAAVVKH
jgi:hypothetical protein